MFYFSCLSLLVCAEGIIPVSYLSCFSPIYGISMLSPWICNSTIVISQVCMDLFLISLFSSLICFPLLQPFHTIFNFYSIIINLGIWYRALLFFRNVGYSWTFTNQYKFQNYSVQFLETLWLQLHWTYRSVWRELYCCIFVFFI